MTDTVSTEQIEDWRGAIGRSEVRRQRLELEALRRYAAAVGSDLNVESHFPPLGHWACFVDTVGPERIGPDGHPRRGGGVIPAITLPRRMFASSDLTFHAPLQPGEPAELTLSVADVRHRSGRSGELVFVELDRIISQDGAPALTEPQTIVYRGAGERVAAVIPAGDAPGAGDEVWAPDTVDLFRYSAATFNSHRIHYDQTYAREEEGYPDIVVHGPFTAARLFAYAAAHLGASPARFSFRAQSPIFVGQPVRLTAGSEPGVFEAIRCDGQVAMSATASL